MRKKKIYLITLFISLCFTYSTSYAQDPQFTQFYAAPTYINPAFVGANVCSRLTLNYRDQWPSIPKSYVTYLLSFDHSIPRYNSGVGILLMNDVAGNGVLKTRSASLQYAYELQFNRKWAFRFGAQGTQTSRSIDLSGQIFPDQANGLSITEAKIPSKQKGYFDISSGVLMYSYRYWFGFSAHHLNQPNQTLLEDNSTLPINYSLHSGVKIRVGGPLKSKKWLMHEYVSPLINIRKQRKFYQLDLGVNYTHHQFVVGVWYRGIPLLKSYNPNYINQDAMAIVIGLTPAKRLSIGYSYDFTISRLTAKTSGGAHEVSITYQFCDYKKLKGKKRKPRLLLPCPKF